MQTIDFSNPKLYNPVYLKEFKVRDRFRHRFGSAGSGKSLFTAQQEIVESYEPVRQNRKTLCVRHVANTLKDSVFQELCDVITAWGLWGDFKKTTSPLSLLNLITNVEFIFRGLDDVGKLKSVKGVDRAWIEEATDMKSSRELNQIDARLRGFDYCQIVLTYNPIDENHWLNTEIHQVLPKDHTILKTTYKDNVRMLAKDPNYAARIESYKNTAPNFYRVYGLGQWGVVTEGLMFENVSTAAEFPQEQIKVGTYFEYRDDIHFYGLDFGYTNPTALIAGHVQDAAPKQRYIQKEILYQTGLDGPGLVTEFDRIKVRKDVPMFADSARPEMIATLKAGGYQCRPCKKFAGSVMSGINIMRRYDLMVAAGSKNLMREYQNYQKKEVDGHWVDEPAANQVDHAIDGARYGIERQGHGARVAALRI